MNSRQRRKAYRHARRLKSSGALCVVMRGWLKGKIFTVTRIFKFGNFQCSLTQHHGGLLHSADSLNIRPLTQREISKKGLLAALTESAQGAMN